MRKAFLLIFLFLILIFSVFGCIQECPEVSKNTSVIASGDNASSPDTSYLYSNNESFENNSSKPPEESSDIERTLNDKKDILTSADLKNKAVNILIMGNSFIASSYIKETLGKICDENDRNILIDTEVYNGANVFHLADSIYKWPGIKDGLYEAVFLCGFYGDIYTEAIDMFYTAIGDNKTSLIFFPVPNENLLSVNNNFLISKKAGYLGWYDLNKYLTDNKGFDVFDLAYEDNFQHTNILGGYGAALLVYNYLYRESPTDTGFIKAYLESQDTIIPGGTEVDKNEMLEIIKTAAYDFVNGELDYYKQ